MYCFASPPGWSLFGMMFEARSEVQLHGELRGDGEQLHRFGLSETCGLGKRGSNRAAGKWTWRQV